ncbi:hypothetical protein F2Q70_00029169 [Brassica cretica]|uniref:Uncharacterized protein n=1 Tax=Brassica cretica TaxID=69181 RepID=A0A8S9FBR2_BRACR|nr:hypothetical protein F2Q70_00029169 [Brassica cretica]KAF3597365.1 hypothetical protein DY000_02020378 [Brassica cretica]
MFGLPSRSQTDETMIDVVKSKDSQEQHEPVKDNTCDDKLHPGAAMTTEERAGFTVPTQKGFVQGA